MDSDNILDRIIRKVTGQTDKGEPDKKEPPNWKQMQLKDYASFGIDSKFFRKSPHVVAGSVPSPKKVTPHVSFEMEYLQAVDKLKSKNSRLANQLIKALS